MRALNTNTWSEAQNDATYAVYVRTLQGISYVNEYLRQTTDDLLDERGADANVRAKVAQFRAEARFIRAYFYWMAIDTFGNVPFITEESDFGSGVNPRQGTRAELFKFCISELTDLASEGSAMPAARADYPRADKGAVYGLLARMYLNAEVYTGTAMWEEAKAACEEIFKMGYELCPDYEALFRGDNGENPEVLQEIIFGAAYDAEQSQSYGGTSYLTLAAVAAEDVLEETVGGETVTCDDKRGRMFYIKGRSESMDGTLYTFLNGWSCLKFNNVPHDTTPAEWADVSVSKAYSDIDYPLIRLGEIYLIYAEACLELGQQTEGLPYMQKLAARAGIDEPTGYTASTLMAERARELYWEGHRRTDLIRYDRFHTTSYLWPYKGGESFGGQGFDSYKDLFAIPPTDLAANVEMKQNPGYVQTF